MFWTRHFPALTVKVWVGPVWVDPAAVLVEVGSSEVVGVEFCDGEPAVRVLLVPGSEVVDNGDRMVLVGVRTEVAPWDEE